MSASESSYADDEYPQLNYILEYACQNQLNLPHEALSELFALVCDEPSQPQSLPPYILIKACRTIFNTSYNETLFDQAIQGLEYLEKLNSIRIAYSTHPEAPSSLHKVTRETDKIYSFIGVIIKRWTFIAELERKPFRPANCLALINILYPTSEKERLVCFKVLKASNESAPRAATAIDALKGAVSWEKAYIAMNRFLELSAYSIAECEAAIDPIPAQYRKMGIKRHDPVLHRISRHLIATDPDGFDPGDENLPGSPEL